MSSAVVPVQFVTEEKNAPDYVAAIEKSGGKLGEPVKPWPIPPDLLDDYSDAQFEPLMMVSAAVAIGFLVKRISDVWLDHTRPGQVIDTRGKTIVVRVAPGLKHGDIVLQSEEGVQVFRSEHHDEAIPLLEKVLSVRG